MRSAFNQIPIRVPIAMRLFMAILLTTVTITLGGLWLLDFAMQASFASYVTQIEAKKLDGFVTQLQQEYQQAGHWPDFSNQDQTDWLRHQYKEFMFSTMHGRREHRSDMSPPDGHFMGHDKLSFPPQMPEQFGEKHGDHAPPFDDHRDELPMGKPQFPLEQSFFTPPRFEPDRLDVASRLGLLDVHGVLLTGLAAPTTAPRREIRTAQGVVGYLTLKPGIDPKDVLSIDFFAKQKTQLLWIGIGCIVLSALVASLLARHFRRPILSLMASADHLIHGEFTTKNHIGRSDELGELGRKMNQLADILSQHESSRRQWVADTSHELRTPVSVLRAQIEAIQDGVREPSPQHLQLMHRQVLSLSRLLDDVYDLARADVGKLSLERRLFTPWFIVQNECEAFSERMQEQGLTLEIIEPQTYVEVYGDPDRIRQIVVNLLENSRRYTNSGGTVSVSSTLQTLQKETFWVLYVDDSLPSVSDAILAHLGERFFRADSSRTRETGGAGLGLALSCQVAISHGGELLFEHSPLGGLRVILRLPIQSTDSEA